MAGRYFTLAVVVMLAGMAFGQANTKGDTDGSGSPGYKEDYEIVGQVRGYDAATELAIQTTLEANAAVGALALSNAAPQITTGAVSPQPQVEIPGDSGGIGTWVKNVVSNFFKNEVQAWHDNYNSNHVAAGVDNVQTSLRRMSDDPVGAAIALAEGAAGEAVDFEELRGAANVIARRKIGFTFDELTVLSEEDQIAFLRRQPMIKGDPVWLRGLDLYNEVVKASRLMNELRNEFRGLSELSPAQERLAVLRFGQLQIARHNLELWRDTMLELKNDTALPNAIRH